MKSMIEALTAGFVLTVEVVPPQGPDPQALLTALAGLPSTAFYGFSVATNPVAKPHMSALALCALLRRKTKKQAILHCTTRDHNSLSIRSLLWGARALGIDTVLAASGDMIAYRQRHRTTPVRDLDILSLIELSRQSGLCTGAVFDPHPETNGMALQADRLQEKVSAGAQFVVTQPVYTRQALEQVAGAVRKAGVPVMLGVLPLRTARHAEFLHERVFGITVAEQIRSRMREAADPVKEGIILSRELLVEARRLFQGVCFMPPFGHYEIISDILTNAETIQ